MPRRPPMLVTIVTIAIVVLAACGSSDAKSSSTDATTTSSHAARPRRPPRCPVAGTTAWRRRHRDVEGDGAVVAVDGPDRRWPTTWRRSTAAGTRRRSARWRSLEVRHGGAARRRARRDRRRRPGGRQGRDRDHARAGRGGLGASAGAGSDYCFRRAASRTRRSCARSARSGVPRPPVLAGEQGELLVVGVPLVDVLGVVVRRRRSASCEIVTGPGATVQRYSTETTACGPNCVPAGRPITSTSSNVGDLEVDLLEHLAHHGVRRRLAGVDPAGDEAPPEVVGAVHEQDATVGVEDRGVGADLRALVAEVAGEPRPHLRLGEVERLRVPAGDDVEQAGAPLPVVRVGRVVQTRSARSRAPRRAPSASRWGRTLRSAPTIRRWPERGREPHRGRRCRRDRRRRRSSALRGGHRRDARRARCARRGDRDAAASRSWSPTARSRSPCRW